MKNPDEKFMAQALALARLGGRSVAPNPMVGAVIVSDGGTTKAPRVSNGDQSIRMLQIKEEAYKNR